MKISQTGFSSFLSVFAPWRETFFWFPRSRVVTHTSRPSSSHPMHSHAGAWERASPLPLSVFAPWRDYFYSITQRFDIMKRKWLNSRCLLDNIKVPEGLV